MRIIIVSRLFPPINAIGAIRPSNFANYLAQYGHHVYCVTEDIGENSYEYANIDKKHVYHIKRGYWGEFNPSRKKSIKNNKNVIQQGNREKPIFIRLLRKTAAQVVHVLDEVEWSKAASKKCLEIIAKENIDCVLTSFGPVSSTLIGLNIKSTKKDIIWISDMRDPMDTHCQQTWRRILYSFIERRMLATCDAVTTVADAIAKKYRKQLQALNNHGCQVYVIENGYEPIRNTIRIQQDGILRIGYTGSLYGNQRRLDALFKAISEIDKIKNTHAAIEIHYAGSDGGEAYRQASVYGAEKHLVNHNMLDRKSALMLQEECDILCVVSWNTEHDQGVLTGKFPEYVRLRKPILSLVSGNLPNAELTQRIEKMNMGFAFEYVRAYDQEKLQDWLFNMLQLKERHEILPMLSREVVEMYSYLNLTKKLEKVMLDLME